MAVVENRFVCDLSKPVQAQALKGNVFSLDNLGSRLSVLIYDNGQPATISGSVTANCILPDGSTVNVNGGLTSEGDGSKAYVDVPQSCLLIPGILKIAIKCISSSVITTLAAIVANVYMTKTDNVITPSQQIITDWNAEISAAIVTQNAAIANQDTKINDLKSALNSLNGRSLPFVFEHGYISSTDGTNSEYYKESRIRMPYPVKLDYDTEISVSGTPGQYTGFIVAYYNADGTFISESSWTKTPVIIPANTNFRLCLTLTSNTNTPETIENIAKNFAWETKILDLIENDISDIRHIVTGVEELEPAVRNLDISLYEKGHINADTGEDSTYREASRARSKNIESYPYDITIVPDDLTVQCYDVCFYNSDNSYAGDSGWKSGEYTIKANQKFRLVLALNSSDTSVVPLETIIAFFGKIVDYPIYGWSENVNASIYAIDRGLCLKPAKLDNALYEKGHINGNTGEDSDYYANARARSKTIERYDYSVIIVPQNSNVNCYIIAYYNDDGSFYKATDWLSGEHEINANQKFRLVLSLSYTDSETRSLETITDFYRIKRIYPIANDNSLMWEAGLIDPSTGKDVDSTTEQNGIRSNRFHIKRGTVIVPHIFGIPQFYVYTRDGSFLGTALSLGLVTVNPNYQQFTGYLDRANAFEFTEDMYIRIAYIFKYGNTNIAWWTYFGGLDEFSSTLAIIPPNYVLPPYIKDAILQQFINVNGKNQFTITFATDVHEYAYHDLAHVYCANLTSKYLLNGGDLLSIPRMTYLETLKILDRHVERFGGSRVPVLITKGNHDIMPNSQYTNRMWYQQMQNPFNTDRMIRNPDAPYDAYFYIDDEEYKVRIICLNTYKYDNGGRGIQTVQLKWICEEALDLSDKQDESEWKVFVFGHSHLIGDADISGDEPTVPADYAFMSQCFGAINKRQNVPNTYGINAIFENTQYTFLAYFCGHVHGDNVVNNDGYMHIVVTCDHPTHSVDGYVRVFGTKDEYAFELMSFDFTNGLIDCYRIGVGYDRFIHYATITNPSTLTLSMLTGTITWSSSDTTVATVSNGTVTKVSAGNAVIKAKAENGQEEYFNITFT